MFRVKQSKWNNRKNAILSVDHFLHVGDLNCMQCSHQRKNSLKGVFAPAAAFCEYQTLNWLRQLVSNSVLFIYNTHTHSTIKSKNKKKISIFSFSACHNSQKLRAGELFSVFNDSSIFELHCISWKLLLPGLLSEFPGKSINWPFAGHTRLFNTTLRGERKMENELQLHVDYYSVEQTNKVKPPQ